MKTRLLASMLLLGGAATLKAQAALDACGMLTPTEAKTALGTSVAPAKDAGKLGEIPYATCTYKNGELVALLLTVYTYKSAAEVKTFFASSMKQAGDTEPVNGLGDGAFWWKSKTSLFVIKGKYMASMFIGPSVAGPKKAAQEVGGKVAAKIP